MTAIAAKIAEAEGRRGGGRTGARTNPATGQQEFAIEEITVTGRRPPRFNIAGPGLFMGGDPNDSLPDGDAFAIRFQNSRAAFLNGLIAQGYKLSADGKTLIGPNGEEVEVEPEFLNANQPTPTPELPPLRQLLDGWADSNMPIITGPLNTCTSDVKDMWNFNEGKVLPELRMVIDIIDKEIEKLIVMRDSFDPSMRPGIQRLIDRKNQERGDLQAKYDRISESVNKLRAVCAPTV